MTVAPSTAEASLRRSRTSPRINVKRESGNSRCRSSCLASSRDTILILASVFAKRYRVKARPKLPVPPVMTTHPSMLSDLLDVIRCLCCNRCAVGDTQKLLLIHFQHELLSKQAIGFRDIMDGWMDAILRHYSVFIHLIDICQPTSPQTIDATPLTLNDKVPHPLKRLALVRRGMSQKQGLSAPVGFLALFVPPLPLRLLPGEFGFR